MKNGYKHANDNEQLSFISLAALTANVTRYLVSGIEQKKEEADGDRKPSDKDESDAEREREYIETRLREIDAFERRYKKRTT